MKWEYKIIDEEPDFDRVDSVYNLDDLGERGWELAAIRPSTVAVGKFVFYFKRAINAEEDV